ncbi:MAG: RdgB/HAM1 family non-canonical purine NTP pyrophosphatase, partial [Clostridia bacterium]
MEIILATNNKNKIREMTELLCDRFDKIYSLIDLNIDCDAEETGATFAENSLIKARAIQMFPQAQDKYILADDTGLCVDALNGEPSINSARYAGDHNDKANRDKLLSKLQGVTNRSARFNCVITLIYPDRHFLQVEGSTEGRILTQEIGEARFGYDCIFFSNDLNKSFGNATDNEKN